MRITRRVLLALLNEPELSLAEKAIYLLITQLNPRSIHELAKMARISRPQALKFCKNLARVGWLVLVQLDQRLYPKPLIPHHLQEEMVRILISGYRASGNKGEFLTKSCSDIWLMDDEYIDNARPDFLISPGKKQPLELDRFHHMLAFAEELNGNQHYQPTEMYGDLKELEKRQVRDLVKESLCRRAGVELVTITALDLEPLTFGALLPDRLPKSAVLPEGPYLEALTKLCRAYRANTPARSPDAEHR